MSTIDPKWIQYDDNVLTTVTTDGVDYLSIKTDAVLTGVSVEKINDSRVEVRTVTEGAPSGTPSSKDFYIEVPDQI